jgi:phage recombination protein Bet
MPADTAVALQQQQQHPSLLAKFASRFGVEPTKMLTTLKATAFRGDVSNEQMMALIIVADQYGLNPWTKEVYAFPDKNNGIVPVVGVDGWARIINESKDFDGIEFTDGPVTKDGLPEWIECTIYRKDRAHPVKTREYMAECKRGTGPWGSHPRRMLRHKAMIQCARIAFGFVGIYDDDEAQRIIEGQSVRAADGGATIDALNNEITGEVVPLTREPVAVVTSPPVPKAKAAPKAALATEPPPLELDGNAPPTLTYAEVADALAHAKGADALDLAADMIRSVADEQQRAELDAEYRRLRKVTP